MDPRYKGTVVEKITPMLHDDAADALKRHGVTKEQYALWLYKSAYNGVGMEVAIVLSLCVAIFAALVTTLVKNDGVALDGRSMVLIVSMAGVAALVLSLTAWTMRHQSGVLAVHIASDRFAYRTSPDYISRISPATFAAITAFTPDIHRLRIGNAVLHNSPALTIMQQRRIALLRPWQTVAGWATLGSLALLFFVGESGLSVVTAIAMTAVGTWLLLRSIQLVIAKQIVDHKSGLVTFGTPAKLLAVFLTAFSIAIVVIGVGGLVMTI